MPHKRCHPPNSIATTFALPSVRFFFYGGGNKYQGNALEKIQCGAFDANPDPDPDPDLEFIFSP